jgi:hypothetical protein
MGILGRSVFLITTILDLGQLLEGRAYRVSLMKACIEHLKGDQALAAWMLCVRHDLQRGPTCSPVLDIQSLTAGDCLKSNQ